MQGVRGLACHVDPVNAQRTSRVFKKMAGLDLLPVGAGNLVLSRQAWPASSLPINSNRFSDHLALPGEAQSGLV